MNKYTSNTINNKKNNNNGTCVYNNDDGGVKNNDGNGNTNTCNQNANRKEKRHHVDRHITYRNHGHIKTAVATSNVARMDTI